MSSRHDAEGRDLPPWIHPTSVVDEPCSLGPGVRIWHFCHVSEGARLGAGVMLGQNVYIAPGVALGAGTRVQNNVSVYQGVECAEDVFIGPGAVFTNVKRPRAHIPRKAEFQKTTLGKGATIGANATVVCGVEVGRYALVGAGAVVTRDVPPFALVVGAPARLLGFVCACGEGLSLALEGPLGERARCGACGASYRREEEGLREEV